MSCRSGHADWPLLNNVAVRRSRCHHLLKGKWIALQFPSFLRVLRLFAAIPLCFHILLLEAAKAAELNTPEPTIPLRELSREAETITEEDAKKPGSFDFRDVLRRS